MGFFRLMVFANFIFSFGFAQAQLEDPPAYVVVKTATAPTIDGKIEKKEWANAKWTADFSDILGNNDSKPALSTRCKMLWDDQYLYIAAELVEPDIWATLVNRDAIVYNDHDFEVFLDPNSDGEQYVEIEINALGTVMDLFMNKPYKKGGRFDLGWDTQGLKTAVKIYGTINNNTDRDKKWTVEMAIPFEALKRAGRISHPTDGSTWRINFSRVQWPMEKEGTSYKIKREEEGRRLRESNWVWSPTGVIDMHVPQRWGFLHFKN